jgi:soluble lytic murein transglycosylase
MKLNLKQNLSPLFSLILILAGISGATWLTPKFVDTWNNLLASQMNSKPEYRLDAPSEVLPLALVKPEARKAQLETIANSKEKSLDRARARYLLASDLINQYQGGEALGYLQELEKEYPTLAPYILLRRGRAYELTNDKTKAQKTWQELIQQYPDSLVAAEALSKLGSYEPQYWQQAIALFPQHPRTHDMAYQLLEEEPNQKDLLLLLAKYDHSSKSREIRARLVKEYPEELGPEHWQIIADGYWDEGLYAQAAAAYQNAVANPQNLYRLARSYQVTNNKPAAKSAYQKLISQFPEAPETGIALRRLASLSSGEEALAYLNRAITKFPEEAPAALTQKASILSSLGRHQEAKQVRESLLNNYPQSDEAANYRWQVAQSLAKSQDLVAAWQWAQEITVNNPDSDVTPEAAFWVGKWAHRLGQGQEAKQAFEYVIANHPQSYYAWRSAVQLGLNVGDFTSIRQLEPQVIKPQTRYLPPAGSLMFKELYLLGEDRDALDLFAAETAAQKELTVAEQFTEGLLQQAQGHNLKGINLIWNLKKKDEPQAIKEWQLLRKSPEYWYALFPFPFEDIILNWSEKRQINPLLVTSLIRQESRFEPEIRSPVGATGLMQVMPGTGKWISSQIDIQDYSLTNPDDNVNFGTWYLDYTHQTYENNSLLAVASYNAGPGNVANWLKKYDLKDPDIFVENIPFPETKGYVETVFGNYWNYLRLYNPEISPKLGLKS